MIATLDQGDRFDAAYLAQLRYNKDAADGFDGVCNKATHLFTAHPAIRTEPLNINFVFSDWDAMLSQWTYLYTRLPYLLTYARLVIERLCATFNLTWPDYIAGNGKARFRRRAVLLWAPSVPDDYLNTQISQFVSITRQRLELECPEL